MIVLLPPCDADADASLIAVISGIGKCHDGKPWPAYLVRSRVRTMYYAVGSYYGEEAPACHPAQNCHGS